MPGEYKVAVIGSTGRGNYGHGIDTVWKQIPQCKVVAVADDQEAGRKTVQERLAAPASYADYREMLEKERPDIVAIGPRWIDRHAEFVLTAAERGCHIYMEKPFCRTLAEADAIVSTCQRKHVKLAIAHQTRYCPVLARVKKLIGEGLIGQVLELRARGKEDARGGAEDLWVLGSHLMNMMQVLAGDPKACQSWIFKAGQPATSQDIFPGNEGLGPLIGDQIQATYQFADGVLGQIGSRKAMGGSPSRFGIQVFGSKGIVELFPGYLQRAYLLPDAGWSPGRSKSNWVPISSAGVDAPEPVKEGGLEAGNAVAVRDLLQAIERDREPLCNAEAGRMTIEMILAVFESYRLKQQVALPLKTRDRHPLEQMPF